MFKYTKITLKEIQSLKMSAYSSVYLVLKLFAMSNNTAWPSYSTLAEHTGLTIGSIKRSIKQLEKDGLIKRTGTHKAKSGQTTIVYSFPAEQVVSDKIPVSDKTPEGYLIRDQGGILSDKKGVSYKRPKEEEEEKEKEKEKEDLSVISFSDFQKEQPKARTKGFDWSNLGGK